jgi:cob(I)alamin adenosyltransferase
MDSPRLIQIVYGEGAGKTTMALGKAIRAHGSGLKVAVVQFMKPGNIWWIKGKPETSIISPMRSLGIDVYSYGREVFVNEPTQLDHEFAIKAFEKAVELNPVVDVLVLDELLNAISFGLIQTENVTKFIKTRGDTELILTGQKLPEEIKAIADQITRVVTEEHPFKNGGSARKGFEY